MIRHLLLFLLLLPLAGRAATYYVSPTGSDAAAGSQAAPFASATKASTVANPGDTVLFGAGIYTGVQTIGKSGTTNAPITFKASGVVTNRSQWNIFANNVHIVGFEWVGGGPYIDGGDCIYIQASTPAYSNIWVYNNYFHDPPGTWDTTVSVIANGRANNVVCSNNVIANWGATQDAALVARGMNWIICNNTISNTYGGDAFRAVGGNHVFRNNRVVELGSAIINVYGAGNPAFNGWYYYNSALTALHKPPNTPSDRQVYVHTNLAGYCWFNFIDDNQFDAITWRDYGYSNSISIGTSDRSITYASAPNEGSPNWTMHHAAIVTPPTGGNGYANHPDFIQIFGSAESTNHVIEGNYVQGNLVGAICQLSCETTAQPPPIRNWIFRNNVFVNVRTASCNIETHWFGNVFYKCGSSSQAAISMAMHNPDDSDYRGSAYGSSVKGNVFIANAGGAQNKGWYSITDDDPYVVSNVGTNCDYNYVCSSTNTWAGVKKDPENDYPPTPFYWYEPHGINGGNPNMPFIHLLNFRITAGSPLIDRGIALPALDVDADGVTRDKGTAPDIGPYEFDPSLKAWWTFDEPGVVTDQRIVDWTGSGHTAWRGGIPTNWIRTEPGPRGTAGVWHQIGVMTNAPPAVYPLSQYAYVTNLTGIEFMTNGTIGLWVKWQKYTNDSTGATRHGTLLDSGGTTLQFAYPPSQATNSWRIAYGPASSTLPAIGPVLSTYSESANWPSNYAQFTHARDATTWHHITMTWEAGGNVIGYENGEPISTNAFPRPFLRIAGRNPLSPPVNATDAIPWLSIGASSHGGSLTWGDDRYPNDGYAVASMDDIRMYDRALSAGEVSTLYAGNTATVSSTPDPGGTPTPTPPNITVQSESLTVTTGDQVTLSVTATGTAPFTYQWAKDGSPMSETASSMTFTASESTTGVYWCTVYNDYGSDTSDSITVTVLPTPPQNLGIIEGAGVIEGNGIF